LWGAQQRLRVKPDLPDGSPSIDEAVDQRDDAGPDGESLEAGSDAGPDDGEATDGPPDTMMDEVPSADAEADSGGEAPLAPIVECTGPGCPRDLAPEHLQLWFRGDVGLGCVPAGSKERVTTWQDSSGRERHARAPAGGVGPLCGASAGTMNGRPVVSFARTSGAENSEHLEIDLLGLLDHSFTIAVVERRMPAMFNAYMIGSELEDPQSVGCDGVNPNATRGLAIGYFDPLTTIATVWGPDCDFIVDVPAVGSKPNVTVLTYSSSVGLSLFVDGKAPTPPSVRSEGLKSGEDPLTRQKTSIKGFIGRGYQVIDPGAEARYKGDIAEIVAFDIELSNEQRTALEAYLHQRWDSGP
jgi:hypothetical protein